jgi:hypothetical protein
MQEFAGVLTDPILLAGPMLEAFDDSGLIDVEQAALEVDAHSVAEDPFDFLRREGGGRENVFDLIGDDWFYKCGAGREERREGKEEASLRG